MAALNKLEVIEKLTDGWLLSGDVESNAAFRIINPQEVRADFDFDIDVVVVRELHADGLLAPGPVPGKKIIYRKNPRYVEESKHRGVLERRE